MTPVERQKQPDNQGATTRESFLDAAIGATKQTARVLTRAGAVRAANGQCHHPRHDDELVHITFFLQALLLRARLATSSLRARSNRRATDVPVAPEDTRIPQP